MHGIGAWKTLCKHETLEQDLKYPKRLYLSIIALVKKGFYYGAGQ